jgi:hypothetical protein
MCKKGIAVIAVTALVCGKIFAQGFDAQEFQVRYTTVMDLSKQDKLAAAGYLSGILEEDPQNPEALIYKGSILAKVAAGDFWFWDKLAHVNEGIDLMTQGMALLDGERGNAVPEERKLTMYINRGLTCAQIPGSFKQQDNAIRELERARNHQYFGFTGQETRATVLALLSKMYQGKKNKELAEELLREAEHIDPAVAKEYAK